jgi:peptide/nickel transport system permease protein
MSVDSSLVGAGATAPAARPVGWVDRAWTFARAKPLGAAGALIILAMLLVAALAQPLAPYDPYLPDYAAQFSRPSVDHWLGTDEFGRDVLSRIMYGARIALFVGFTASFAGCSIGGLLGVLSAYCGGTIDLLLERVMDVLLAFPQLILALAVAIPIIPRAARVVRATALSVKENQYVEAAHGLGASHGAVIRRHLLPNVFAPYLIMLTAQLGTAILAEAALSYLGLGAAEPTPSWGLMLSGSAPAYAEKAPWIGLFPGIAISLAVFGFSLFGDSLRDALDPKLRGK